MSVLDIAGMAVHAAENPGELVGERIDIASDRPGDPLQQVPLDMVRQWAGEDVATMFENNTGFLDIETLHARCATVRWHVYAEWTKTMDWDRILAG